MDQVIRISLKENATLRSIELVSTKFIYHK